MVEIFLFIVYNNLIMVYEPAIENRLDGTNRDENNGMLFG